MYMLVPLHHRQAGLRLGVIHLLVSEHNIHIYTYIYIHIYTYIYIYIYI